MIHIGKINSLRIVKEVDFGLYLDGGEERGEILLPLRYIPQGAKVDDTIDVFIYFDSEDRIIATTETPYAQVGEFAFLEVVDVNNTGAFMNWGLIKDLLLPYDEQTHRPEVGKSYVVYILQDGTTGRPIASMKIRDFLDDESLDDFQVGQEVELFSANKTDLGYQMIINNTHVGLLHQHEAIRSIKHGERLQGFIQNIRDDHKIDVCLHMKPSEKTSEITDLILYKLKANGGFLALHDKSDPQDIKKAFGVSKGMFKKALGALYKRKKISLESGGIRLKE
ncbi:MAG TPA: GntR family transcriptional regulator [Ghiorsea sp.]|nr:GntR family transcriptional regulator [Ghiorsea sp.]HIP07573.1 GntR family transcriptional regulator [Mariprofundaceae bacterium]